MKGRFIAPNRDGKSAYEIAVANGFVGTEAEWLDSLEGNDGDNGITPTIGVNGNWYIGEVDTGVKAEGSDGRTPEFRVNAGWMEWKYTDDVSWTQLFQVPASLTKATGTDVTTGTDDAKYVTPKAIADSNVLQSAGVKLVEPITQAAYDALDPKVSTTLYLIIG